MTSFNLRALPSVHRAVERVRASSIGTRLVRGLSWSMGGSVASRLAAMAAAVIAARVLGKLSYGKLGIIQSTVALFGTLAGFGLGTTAAKYVAEFRTQDPAKAGRIIAMCSAVSWITSCLLAGTLYVLAPWLCLHSLAAPELTGPLRISSALLLFTAVNGAQLGALSGFESFKKVAVTNTVSAILTLVLVTAGAGFFGLAGTLWGMAAAQAGGCALNYFFLRAEAARFQTPVNYLEARREVSILWNFAVPAVLGSLVLVPANWVTGTVLVQRPNGYEQMGAYNASNQWFNALMWLPYMLGNVLLPIMSDSIAANSSGRKQTSRLLKLSIAINAGATLPLVLLGSALSMLIMRLYGPSFARDWPTLVVALATAAVLAVQIPVAELIAASGRMWIGLLMNAGWALAFLVATWLLLDWGAFGLACARLAAYLLHATWTFGYAFKVVREKEAAEG